MAINIAELWAQIKSGNGTGGTKTAVQPMAPKPVSPAVSPVAPQPTAPVTAAPVQPQPAPSTAPVNHQGVSEREQAMIDYLSGVQRQHYDTGGTYAPNTQPTAGAAPQQSGGYAQATDRRGEPLPWRR